MFQHWQCGVLQLLSYSFIAFGLTSSSATFQRLMVRYVEELNLKECLIFLGDILVFPQNIWNIFFMFSENQNNYVLKFKPSECDFSGTNVKYSGHVVSESGIESELDKIKA